ncbi:hypothetical protein [uncultured Roseibium sp.]|uniref:hypothetical protein n=1 Tax=uncultured Roseibium sp. TaxID=1936171 RepID=UPI00321620A4
MTTIIRSGFAAVFLLVAFAANALAAGVDVNATTTGLALRGYDPVSYFKAGEPQAGDINLTADYKGATYRFTTKENQEAFQANPAKYAPSNTAASAPSAPPWATSSTATRRSGRSLMTSFT